MPFIEPAGATVATEQSALARRLTLPLAVLFGLGVTIGAGIYVLVGATAARAGMHAALAFLLAALVMAPTAASFAELAGRMPVSAGEAPTCVLGLAPSGSASPSDFSLSLSVSFRLRLSAKAAPATSGWSFPACPGPW